MGASGRWFKSLLSLKKPSTTDQEKGSGDNKGKKKWKLWRTSSAEGSSLKKGSSTVVAVSEDKSDNSSLTVALAAVVRAPPKDFMIIKKEWAATRIQAVFRGFLARRALRALRAVVRLQAIFRGRQVRKQAAVTLKCMQALVRVQARVRARSVRNSPEGKAVQKLLEEHRNQVDPIKQAEHGWCDLPGTVDEVKTKLRMRQEGAIKRDRAMAYSLSTQQPRQCASPNSRAVATYKHHNLDNNKSLGCTFLERWMATKPWESPISRRNNGVTTRISVKSVTTSQSTPSSSAISSECMHDDSPVSTSYTYESPSTVEAGEVLKPSYMNLTESSKAKLKPCKSSSSSSQNPKSSTTTFLDGDSRSSSGSENPSVNLWKDLCATPLRASYQKRYTLKTLHNSNAGLA